MHKIQDKIPQLTYSIQIFFILKSNQKQKTIEERTENPPKSRTFITFPLQKKNY